MTEPTGEREQIEVLDVGTEVSLGPEGDRLKGIITGVAIYDRAQVQYRVVWWDCRTRKEDWVTEGEVIVVE